MAKKLTKVQKETLEASIATFDKTGKNIKPIFVALPDRDNIDTFGKSFATYNKHMFALVDAGLIASRSQDDVRSHAYIVDIERARAVVAAGILS